MPTSSARPPLRLWPGVILAVLILFNRFGLKALIPGFDGYSTAMMATIGTAAALLLWWLIFSRAPWLDRVGGLVLLIGGLAGTWFLRHESMGPNWFIGYAMPLLLVAFVVALTLSRNLDTGARRAVVAVVTLLAGGAWLFVRTDGIDGDHDSIFASRFSATAEQQMLEQLPPIAGATSPDPEAAEAVQMQPEVDEAAPTGTDAGAVSEADDVDSDSDTETSQLAAAAPAPEASAAVSAADQLATSEHRAQEHAAWNGFRGPARDGSASGIRLASDWHSRPPEEMWRRAVGPGWSSFAVRGELIYTQEQRGDDEVVTAYRLDSGEPVWLHGDPVRFFESNAGAGPRSTPEVHGGRVYTVGATGLVNALDAASGQRLWSRDLAADSAVSVPDWGFSGSPLVLPAQDLVVVPAGGRLLAYRGASGDIAWKAPESKGGYSSPQRMRIDGEEQLLIMNGGGLTAISPVDGSQLWHHEWGGFPMVQPALVGDGELLISANQGSGVRRLAVSRAADADGWTSEERWTSLSLKPYFNDFVVHQGHAYGFDGRILAAIDLESGERRWKGGRYGSGQMVLVPDSDQLVVLSEKGEIALVSATPDGFDELGRLAAISGKTWNHPVLVGEILLIRNGAEMAAYRLPVQEG